MGNFKSIALDSVSGKRNLYRIPHCHEELTDWCVEATDLSAVLSASTHWVGHEFKAGVQDFIGPTVFVPIVDESGDPISRCFRHDFTPSDFASLTKSEKIIIFATKSSPSATPNLFLKINDPATYNGRKVKKMKLAQFVAVLAILRRLNFLLHIAFGQDHGQEPNARSMRYEQQQPTRRGDRELCRVKNSNASREECSICMDSEVQIVLPCVHALCSSCTKAWVETKWTCPICREVFNKTDYEANQWQIGSWCEEDTIEQCRMLGEKLGSLWTGFRVEVLKQKDFVEFSDLFSNQRYDAENRDDDW